METSLTIRRIAELRTRRVVRWLHSRAFSFTPEQISLDQGFRGASAVALLVGIALFLHHPELAWAAFAAFWTCLADPGGSRRVRLWVMGTFLLFGTIIAGVVSAIAVVGAPVSDAVVFAVVAFCTLAGLRRAGMAMVGTLASVVAVVAIEQPVRLMDAPFISLTFLGGGALAIILSVAIRPADHCRGARRAVAAVFRELRDMAAETASSGAEGPAIRQSRRRLEADHRRFVRESIERAWLEVEAATAYDPSSLEALELKHKLQLSDRIFAALIALSHARAAGHMTVDESQWRDLLGHLGAALTQVARETSKLPVGTVSPRAADRLRARQPITDDVGSRLLDRLRVLLDELVDAPATDQLECIPPVAPIPASRVDRNGLPRALRRASVVLITYVIAHVFSLPYIQWATMAAVVVTHPDAEIAWPRMIERVLGSVVGSFVAAGLGLLLVHPWEQVAVVFLIATATLAFRSVNYTLFVLFLTPLFILVAQLLTPELGQLAASARAVDNVLGSVLPLLACILLWPARPFARFAEKLAEAVDANLHYAAIAPGADGKLVEVARKRAGICSNAAEHSLYCSMPLISRGQPSVADARALLTALRRLAGAAATAHETGDPGLREQLKASAAEVSLAHRAYTTGRSVRLQRLIDRPMREPSRADARIAVTLPVLPR